MKDYRRGVMVPFIHDKHQQMPKPEQGKLQEIN